MSNQDQTLPFSSGNVVKVITEKGQTSGSSQGPDHKTWQGSKVGDLRSDDKSHSNYILWGIYLNSDDAYLDDDIVVKDPIDSSMKLDEDSVYFYVDGQNYDVAEFEDSFPGSTVDTNNNALNLKLSKNYFSGRSIMVGYKTSLTDTSVASYENTAKVTYRLHGETNSTTVNESKSVQNIAFDAHVYGTKAKELKVIKLDASDKKTPIKGVEFEVTFPDGKTKDFFTDKNGIIDLTAVEAGCYSVQEIKAAEGYVLDNQQYKVTVSDSEAGQALVVYNQKQKESIPWTIITPSKKSVPWTDLQPSKKSVPWTDLQPSKKSVPWTDLQPSKKSVPWTDLQPSQKVVSWTDLVPSKKTIPWTEINEISTTDFTPVIPKEDGKSEVPTDSKVVKPAIPWTDLAPTKERGEEIPVKQEDTVVAWQPVKAKPINVGDQQPASNNLIPLAQNDKALATDDKSASAGNTSAVNKDVKSAASQQNELPQTGSTIFLAVAGIFALVGAAALGMTTERN